MKASWTKNKILFIEPNPVEPKINYFWMNEAQLDHFEKFGGLETPSNSELFKF